MKEMLDFSKDPTNVSAIIETMDMVESTRNKRRTGWRLWLEWCHEHGFGPLEGRGPELLGFLKGEHPPRDVMPVLSAVRFGYEISGLLSPTWDPAVRRFRGLQYGGDRPLADYRAKDQRYLKLRTSDYLRWCRETGRTPVPASPEDVGAYLLYLADQYKYATVAMARKVIWHLHRERGLENVTRHPAVSEALVECRRRCDDRKRQPRPVSPQVQRIRASYERHWKQWCEAEGIDPPEVTPAEAVRYLDSIEGLSVDLRIRPLALTFEGTENPFTSVEVTRWRREYLARVPEMRAKRKAEQARKAELPDPALESTRGKLGDKWLKPGLTAEDRALVQRSLDSRMTDATARDYYHRGWQRCVRWLEDRGIPIDGIEPVYVAAYVAHRGQEVTPGTMGRELRGIAIVWERLVGDGPNPAESAEVREVLRGLYGAERNRRIRPSQKLPIRESHYQELVDRCMEVPPWNKEWVARLYNLVDIAVIGFGRDGMLRGTELCSARKTDLEEIGGGAGRLYIPYSKNDREGDGAYVYISERSMGDVERMWDAMVNAGQWDEDEERIFPLKRAWISERIKDAVARLGLVGAYGSHSLRIGMAQDLAVAGFTLPMIMSAGRWKSPEMPGYYTRGLVPEEFAVARLHEMWHHGYERVEREVEAFEVLRTYRGLLVG